MATKSTEKILGEFATRRTGNSLTLTVPKSAGVPEGKKFILVSKDDDTLEYRAAKDNPWLDGTYSDIDFRSELDRVGNYGLESPIGKEKPE
ncbi:hypothetical protein AYR62_10545 [Secundilactobacillus paracollinoides]|uniref:AbrB family transcriptional regulator n=1 Tax=Secundilactobacillus paracollinoides TaxID=240427 RepID=A0A1B2IY93_9LACO|nr:hypothetical protein [Secundilactobacillus paracollinoides]ANZ61125.1 hypothetical protein AYR61_07085 [Secundilactobacillus paracollinoides]ANZ64479.1 hypothetical protein AYR62_10545 [Secundilactobacillus paracollinoides]ANZ67046.1 hypothetical protein AYR63_07830 [Secundilactobacillus paracollinoides]